MPKVKYELNHALKDDGGAIRIDVKRFFRELDTYRYQEGDQVL